MRIVRRSDKRVKILQKIHDQKIHQDRPKSGLGGRGFSGILEDRPKSTGEGLRP